MSGAAVFQQLAAGAPSAPLDDDEHTRILTDPSQRDRVLEDHYNLLETKLGRGQFSEVRYGLFKANVTQRAAIKVIEKAGSASSVRIAQEVQIMRHCNKIECAYLVKLFDVFETAQHLYMVMEYCPGSLSSLLEVHGRLSETDARRLVRQLASQIGRASCRERV